MTPSEAAAGRTPGVEEYHLVDLDTFALAPSAARQRWTRLRTGDTRAVAAAVAEDGATVR